VKKIKFFQDRVILIYTMGKVGSSSLENSINDAVHLHSLYQNPPNPMHWKLRNPTKYQKVKSYFRSKLNLLALYSARKIDIVTVVRDPMQRNISMYFQTLPFWLAQGFSEPRIKPIIDSREEGFDVIIDGFNKVFNHEYASLWFDKEIKRFSKIDVLNQQFDKTLGYKTYKNGKYNLLTIRVDILNKCENVIGEFFNLNVSIKNTNSGENKWYAEAYKRFKSEYVAPPKIVESVTNSKFYKTFF
jgi:hypothetical protein